MPFTDTRSLPDGEVIERDVVVIGSGPAGLAIASELAQSSLTVAVLESGGFEYDEDTQALAEGQVVGRPYPDLDTVRLRFFGGASNHWGGNVRPLDPLDFASRPWVPNSGWPFGHQELAPYYKRAAKFCGLPDTAFTPDATPAGEAHTPFPFAEGAVESMIFHTIDPEFRQFGTSYRARMKSAPNIDVLLFANVTKILTDQAARTVQGVEIRTLTGKRMEARAKHYVLATGGIENPRLLLLSSSHAPNGLGNDHGLVGRFFMDHLTVPEFADLIPSDPFLDLGFYKPKEASWGETWGVLQLADVLQRDERLPNIRFQLSTVINSFNENIDNPGMRSLRDLIHCFAENAGDGCDINRHIANLAADIDTLAHSAYIRLRYHPNYPMHQVELVQIGEQTPNPDSRIRLGNELDRLGQRKVELDWQVTQRDSNGVRESAHLLARQLGRSGVGRLATRFPDDVFDSIDPKPHLHHMGTTRMHADPKRGVVDADCRVHGMSNLFIAGSSVFPAVGNVNPTFTILALAMRLSDHLRRKMTA